MIPSVTKQPSESRLYSMDFSALLASGETLSTVTSVSTTLVTVPALTIGAGSVSGVLCQFRVSVGKTGNRYKVTAVVTTSAGNTLEGEGYVNVEDI